MKKSKKEILRWVALTEAIKVIDQHCEKKGVEFDQLNLKPNAINDYVDQIYTELSVKYSDVKD